MSALQWVCACAMVVSVVVGVPIMIYQLFTAGRHDTELHTKLRGEAELQIRSWLDSVAAKPLSVEAGARVPAHTKERITRSDGRIIGYSLTWFVRTSEGQYVMLLSTDLGKPFVKVLEDRYARVVLKEHYRPPDSAQ